MTKLLKRMITMLLVVTCLVGTVVGCSSNSSNDNETKEAVTTKKAEVTTTEAQTEEPTEEPTTEYVYKGEKMVLEEIYSSFLEGLTLNKGDIIYLNDIVPSDVDDMSRGIMANILVNRIGTQEQSMNFEEKYLVPGAANPSVSYEENFSLEYIKDESISFHFIEIISEEIEGTIHNYVCFDIY